MLDVEILRYESLTEIINEFRTAPSLMLRASGIFPEIGFDGQTKTWDIRGVPRDIGTFEGKHSAAGTRAMTTIGQQTARLARTFKSVRLQGSYLLDLRRPGSLDRQRLAEDQVAQAQLSLRNLIDRQDEFMIAKALQGELTITIDDLPVTIDYQIPASHMLTVDAGVPLSWDDPAADILFDLEAMQTLITQDSGFDPATIWGSRATLRRIMQNETVKEYFASTPAGVQALTEGTIGRFFGLNWRAYDGTYKDAAGVVQRYIPEGRIIMTPSPDTEWAEMAVGTDSIMSDDDREMIEVRGLYAFARGQYNPASIEFFAGKVRLPIIKTPAAMVVADIVP